MFQGSPQPAISVLIRTFNSEKTLGSVIESLDFADEDRCIIVDSGSTDRTLTIAAEHGATVVRVPPPFNYSRSLNAGFYASSTPLILVLSSHCIPLRPDLLSRMRKAAVQAPPDVAVLYGRVSLYDPGPVPESLNIGDLAAWQARSFSGGGNGFAMYPRPLWDSQPFDESLLTAEDVAWLRWALTAGYRAGMVRDAVVLYRNQGSISHMFAKGWHEVRVAAIIRGGPPLSIGSRLHAIKSTGINSLYLAKLLVERKFGVREFIRMEAHALGAGLATIMAPSYPRV